MSDKKSKSKSKEKGDKAEKPPKDAKSKKSKEEKPEKDDTKSKKSVDKASKKPSKKQTTQVPKIDLDLSQDIGSDFLKNPFSFNPPALQLDEALCIHHNEPNTIFCQVCEQTGCESCLLYGPHNNQMHRITKIDEAFQARYLYLNDVVCKDLIQKRDKMTKYLEDLTLLSDQLRYVKGGIEKMTKMEYNQMLQRLRVSSGGKFAVLHHQMAQLQKDLQAINSLGNEFFELTNVNPINKEMPQQLPTKGIVPFLLRSKFLQEEAEQLISKPIKTTVEVYPYDLPRELTEKKMILDKNRSWIQLLKIKDECIWNLTQEKKNLRNKLWQNFNEQARGQIDEWAKLKIKIQNQLIPLQMTCEKCRVPLEEDSVNSQCSKGDFHVFKH